MHNFEEIVVNGKYYYPANSHYNNDVTVICDRCYKSDLVSSIGYNNLDLCLKCADIVSGLIKRKEQSNEISQTPYYRDEPLTFMEQNIFKPDMKTKMRQDIFNTRKKMAQGNV